MACSTARRSRPLKFRSMVLPDTFIDHDKPEKLYAQAGLDAKGIVKKVLETLGQEKERQAEPQRLTAARRIDLLLVERGFFASRAKAQEAIAAGLVMA